MCRGFAKVRRNICRVETGENKLFDVLPYITGTWYKELKNDKYFKTVHIILKGGCINGGTCKDL